MTETNYFIPGEPLDRYEIHQQLAASLEGYDTGRVLWAMVPTQGGTIIRVRTEKPGRYSLPWEALDMPVVGEITAGEQFLFILDANPRKALSSQDGKRGKRVGIAGEAEIAEWLGRQSQTRGFKLLSTNVAPKPGLQIRRRGQRLYFTRATISGALEVTDPAAFQMARNAGLGGGKAFGMGLLVLLPNEKHVNSGEPV